MNLYLKYKDLKSLVSSSTHIEVISLLFLRPSLLHKPKNRNKSGYMCTEARTDEKSAFTFRMILLLFIFMGSAVTLIRSVFLRDLSSKTRDSCPRKESGHQPAAVTVRQHPSSVAQASSHTPGQTGWQSLLPQVQVRLEHLATTVA